MNYCRVHFTSCTEIRRQSLRSKRAAFEARSPLAHRETAVASWALLSCIVIGSVGFLRRKTTPKCVERSSRHFHRTITGDFPRNFLKRFFAILPPPNDKFTSTCAQHYLR